MNLPGILQMTDTLEAGGAERVAVNLANLLPRQGYRSYLCATRREGPLASLVSAEVGKICLARTRRLDPGGLRRLVAFIKAHNIELLHAHSTALFVALQAALFPPYPKVIWHIHSSNYATEARAAWLYGPLARRANGVIIVNRQLTAWVQQRLRVPRHNVWHVPNFVIESADDSATPDLPGQGGQRIVCVANLRPEKGHLTLIEAMARVAQQAPGAHLILVGAHSNQEHYAKIAAAIRQFGLVGRITLAGHQHNVPSILRNCDIGVLSSYSEAFPLALVEYGKAGLGVVTTEVGECPAILDHGRAGVVVTPHNPAQLAEALLSLLGSSELRKTLGETLRQRVNRLYTAEAVLEQIGRIYAQVLPQPAVAHNSLQAL